MSKFVSANTTSKELDVSLLRNTFFFLCFFFFVLEEVAIALFEAIPGRDSLMELCLNLSFFFLMESEYVRRFAEPGYGFLEVKGLRKKGFLKKMLQNI